MKAVGDLAKQGTKTMASGARWAQAAPQPIPEHWVDKLFARFSSNWRRLFTSRYDGEAGKIALKLDKAEWMTALAGVSRDRLALGMRKLPDTGRDNPISPPAFKRLCQPEPKDIGAPEVEEALYICLQARSTRGGLAERFKHPAVFIARRRVPAGKWYAIERMREADAIKAFAPHYTAVIGDIFDAGEAVWPQEKRLTENRTSAGTGETMTREEAMREIRKCIR